MFHEARSAPPHVSVASSGSTFRDWAKREVVAASASGASIVECESLVQLASNAKVKGSKE